MFLILPQAYASAHKNRGIPFIMHTKHIRPVLNQLQQPMQRFIYILLKNYIHLKKFLLTKMLGSRVLITTCLCPDQTSACCSCGHTHIETQDFLTKTTNLFSSFAKRQQFQPYTLITHQQQMSAPQKKGQSKTKLPQIKMSSIQLPLN